MAMLNGGRLATQTPPRHSASGSGASMSPLSPTVGGPAPTSTALMNSSSGATTNGGGGLFSSGSGGGAAAMNNLLMRSSPSSLLLSAAAATRNNNTSNVDNENVAGSTFFVSIFYYSFFAKYSTIICNFIKENTYEVTNVYNILTFCVTNCLSKQKI